MNAILRSNDLAGKNGISILPLDFRCRGYDHYISMSNSGENGRYIVIRNGDSTYQRFNSLTDGTGASKRYNLHPNFRNGDHYFATIEGWVYCIKGDTIYGTSNLGTEPEHPRKIHSTCRGGLFYWSRGTYRYFLKQHQDKVWYHRVNDITEKGYKSSSRHEMMLSESVINFIPGGISLTRGDTYGKWKHIRSHEHSADGTLKQEISIEKREEFNLPFRRPFLANQVIPYRQPLDLLTGLYACTLRQMVLSLPTYP